MQYNYKGFWSDSYCDIEAHRRSDGKLIFVASELPDSPGTSVTNAPRSAFALKSTPSKTPEGMARLSLKRFEGACGCHCFLILTTAIRERNTVP